MFVSILLQAFAMKGEDLSVYFSNPVGMVKGWITPGAVEFRGISRMEYLEYLGGGRGEPVG